MLNAVFLFVLLEMIIREDNTLPLWELLSALIAIIFMVGVFIVKIFIDVDKLKDRQTATEAKLAEGDKEFKAVRTEMHGMSKLLTKINTKLNIFLKMEDDTEED